MSKKIGVVVSGRGSNLQSIIDHIAEGKLNVEIAVVVSDHKEAFALERAAKAGIPTAVVERKGCKDKAEFEDKMRGSGGAGRVHAYPHRAFHQPLGT